MLKGIEVMIDIQRQVQDMMKIAGEANTTITEIEGVILKASIHNLIMNMTYTFEILEDL